MGTLKDFIGSADEAAAFFNTDEFADTASYTPFGGGGPYSVNGIHNAPFTSLNAQSQQVEAYSASFICLLADLPGTITDGTLVVKGTTYNITDKADSDDGFYTTLILSEDEA
jgi:hypothetical protein